VGGDLLAGEGDDRVLDDLMIGLEIVARLHVSETTTKDSYLLLVLLSLLPNNSVLNFVVRGKNTFRTTNVHIEIIAYSK
jgi:hypothetical protein